MTFAIHQYESAICIKSPLHPKTPPTSLPPTPLDCHRTLSWVPCFIHQTHIGYLFYIW